jgi:hypothetical protein
MIGTDESVRVVARLQVPEHEHNPLRAALHVESISLMPTLLQQLRGVLEGDSHVFLLRCTLKKKERQKTEIGEISECCAWIHENTVSYLKQRAKRKD